MVCWTYNGRQLRLQPRVFTFGITGRPVPLLALPRPGIVRPLQRLDGISPNLFANLTQSLTAVFPHRRYTCTQANEASLPLHAGCDQPNREFWPIRFLFLFLIDRSGYMWLRVSKSGKVGRPVPLSGLPHPETMRPLRRLDGVSPNLFANLIQSLTGAFSNRHYAGIRNIKASLPLHLEMIL